MKERPILFSTEMVEAILEGRKTMTRRICKGARELSCAMDWPIESCPYGRVGDRLWVRETWSPWADKQSQIACHAENQPCLYRADYRDDCKSPLDIGGDYHWHPSIFMSRKFSRIILEIINIRVARLQEITEEDTIKEGFSKRIYFLNYWDKLNAKRGYASELNPWVWVIEWCK